MNKFEELVKNNSSISSDQVIKNLKITIKNTTNKKDLMDNDDNEQMEGIETMITDNDERDTIINPNLLKKKHGQNEQEEDDDDDDDEIEFHVNLDKAPPTLQNTILNEKIYLNESLDKVDETKLDFDLEFISEPNLAILYDSLNLTEENFVDKDADFDIKNPNLYRKDSIHIFGVDNLKTDEIFDFFKLYKPFAIEWINDSSCNLVWKNEIHAANALLYLTRPYDSVINNSKKEQRLPPQGSKWRKSIDLAKDKYQLYMRYVRVKTDRKMKGAESKSKFYVKYGNPNYGNIKGLISESKRREMKVKQLNRATSDLELDNETNESNGRKLVSYDDVTNDDQIIKYVNIDHDDDDFEMDRKRISSKVEKRKTRGLYSDELNNDHNDEDRVSKKSDRYNPYGRLKYKDHLERSRTKTLADPNDLRNKLNKIKRLSSNY